MKRRTNIFVKVAVCFFLVFAFVTILNLSMQVSTLKEKQGQLELQVYEKKLAVEQLKDEYAQEMDEEYIQKIAREELGYRMPGEVVYYNDLTK